MNMNDIFEFMRQEGSKNSNFPWHFIAIKDDTLVQTGGGSTFDDELYMMLIHIESLREIFKRHGDEIGFKLDVNSKKVWMGFLASLYLDVDVDASHSKTTTYRTLLDN